MRRGDRVGGRYEITGEATRGGASTIFRARDIRSQREVAVKLIGTDPARFAREAAIVATLSDPAIVGYVDHGRIPDGPSYLVMEWVNGETLAARLARAPLSTHDAVAIVSQVAHALVVLHGAGVVHRDVKPTNIMLVEDHVTLVDFGIARHRHDRVTVTGGVVGTAGYMAPEQARGDTDLDHRVDVFALGCVAYECLARSPAFRAESVLALKIKALLHDPARLVGFGVMAELDALVTRMLSRDRDTRPDAISVIEALASITPVETPHLALIADATSPTATTEAPACAVVISLDGGTDQLAGVAGLAGLGVTATFDGGAIAIVPELDDATDLALAVARQVPSAAVAVAAGRSADHAIDRSAKLIGELDVAAAAGARIDGAWLDAQTIVPAALAVDHIAGLGRLRRRQ